MLQKINGWQYVTDSKSEGKISLLHYLCVFYMHVPWLFCTFNLVVILILIFETTDLRSFYEPLHPVSQSVFSVVHVAAWLSGKNVDLLLADFS